MVAESSEGPAKVESLFLYSQFLQLCLHELTLQRGLHPGDTRLEELSIRSDLLHVAALNISPP